MSGTAALAVPPADDTELCPHCDAPIAGEALFCGDDCALKYFWGRLEGLDIATAVES